MAHFSDVPFVMTTSPTEARAIDHALTLLIEQHRRDGHVRPPAWILELQATFHDLWDSDAAKVEQSQTVSLSDRSETMSTMAASQILGKTEQAIRDDCREGRLDGFQVRRSWVIDRASVMNRLAEQKQKEQRAS